MPNIVETNLGLDFEAAVSALSPPRDHAKIHLSEILSYLGGVFGHFDPSDKISQRNIDLGLAFERGMTLPLVMVYPGRYLYNVPIERDGILMTPDLVDMWNDDLVDEYKLTWSNEEPGSPKFWRFETQLGAYCYGYRTTRGRLIVGRVNEWSKEVSAIKVYHYTFTQQELLENWLQIKGAQRAMISSRQNGKG